MFRFTVFFFFRDYFWWNSLIVQWWSAIMWKRVNSECLCLFVYCSNSTDASIESRVYFFFSLVHTWASPDSWIVVISVCRMVSKFNQKNQRRERKRWGRSGWRTTKNVKSKPLNMCGSFPYRYLSFPSFAIFHVSKNKSESALYFVSHIPGRVCLCVYDRSVRDVYEKVRVAPRFPDESSSPFDRNDSTSHWRKESKIKTTQQRKKKKKQTKL